MCLCLAYLEGSPHITLTGGPDTAQVRPESPPEHSLFAENEEARGKRLRRDAVFGLGERRVLLRRMPGESRGPFHANREAASTHCEVAAEVGLSAQ